MRSGSYINITNGIHTRLVQLESVHQGRVTLTSFHGAAEVDLVTGALKLLRPPRGLCEVDIRTGRVLGTPVRVAAPHHDRLEALETDEIIVLDNHATAQVVEKHLAGGTVEIYVPFSGELPAVAPNLDGWRVASDGVLRELRDIASPIRAA